MDNYTLPVSSVEQAQRIPEVLDFLAAFQGQHGLSAAMELKSAFECRWVTSCFCQAVASKASDVVVNETWCAITGALLGLIDPAGATIDPSKPSYTPSEHAHQVLYLVDDLVLFLEGDQGIPSIPAVWPGAYRALGFDHGDNNATKH